MIVKEVLKMHKDRISKLRDVSRKLVRELGMLQLNSPANGYSPQHWHALIEIDKSPGVTISQLANMLLLSVSAMSRIIAVLVAKGLVEAIDAVDKREKSLMLTQQGRDEIHEIDQFSNEKIKGAFQFLEKEEQQEIIVAIEKYAHAMEKSRTQREGVKILKLSTSRVIRRQIVNMIEAIQEDEFNITVTPTLNAGIMRAEEEYYFNNSYNFWYAVNSEGEVIGSIGLKKIDDSRGELKKFFVAEKFRGMGVAQKLMAKVLESAQNHGIKTLYLGTVHVLKAAHRFYEKLGFQKIAKSQLPSEFESNEVDTDFFKGDLGQMGKL